MTSAQAATASTGLDSETGLLGLVARTCWSGQADAERDAAVLEIQRVRVALRAVADDGDLLAWISERSASLS